MGTRAVHENQGARLLSPRVWQGFPDLNVLLRGPEEGFFFFDDFLNFPSLSTSATNQGYVSYLDSGGTLVQTPEVGGVIKASTDGTDNDEISMGASGNAGYMCKFAAASYRRLCFEARVKLGQIATQNFFVGLAEEGCAVNTLFADSGGALADKDYVGFQVQEDDASYMDVTYKTNGVTAVVHKSQAQLLVADTYYRVGFRYDSLKGVEFFINNAKVGATLQITDTGFPDGEGLTLLFGGAAASGAAKYWYMDWWALGGVEA